MPVTRIHHFDMYYEAAGEGIPCLFVHGGLGGGNGSATFRQYQMPALSQHAGVLESRRDKRSAWLDITKKTLGLADAA
jgi:hypothetical protein